MLRGFTTTPEECFFCVWDGYGWEGRRLASTPGTAPVILPDPVPEAVRNGARVRLAERDYLLYTGPVEAITAPAEIGHGQCANLAWPTDHAWCVASEIDLACTYVAGSTALVDVLLADGRIEVLPADPDDPIDRVEAFVVELVGQPPTSCSPPAMPSSTPREAPSKHGSNAPSVCGCARGHSEPVPITTTPLAGLAADLSCCAPTTGRSCAGSSSCT